MFLFNSSFWRSVPGVLLGVAVVVGVVVGGWQAGWWFTAQNANREATVQQQGVGNQSAMRSEIPQKIADVQRYTLQIDNPAYAAMKLDIEQSRSYAAQLVCGDAAQLNDVTELAPADQSWVTTNCVGGELSATSKYAVTTQPGQ
jgi:cytochrome bd-type quinol oxidase subunit 1